MFVRHRLAVAIAAGCCLTLTGCNAWQTRAEFAAPQSRWNSAQSSPAGVEDAPPPIGAQYCYRTLARVDCFNEPQPDRVTGYSGLYPDPYSLPQKH
jgi:hypothetical protein